MLETPFSFLTSKKSGEIPIFGTFFSETINFGLYFLENRHFSRRPYFITSLRRHTSTAFHDFGINGKKRPYPILWYQTTVLRACQFSIHR